MNPETAEAFVQLQKLIKSFKEKPESEFSKNLKILQDHIKYKVIPSEEDQQSQKGLTDRLKTLVDEVKKGSYL